jgi:hypothetical protein
VDPLGKDREDPIHDLVPLFRVDLLGEVHRALQIGEEDGHLLPLALEGAAGGRIFSARWFGV